MAKRFLLFFAVNILITATIALICSLLGVGSYMSSAGINYTALAFFCLIWGMGGSFISLLLSKFIAKMQMGVKIIDPKSPSQYDWVLRRTHELARQANLKGMPEVGVFDSPVANAFATGPSQRNSLVAVSTGLLNTMSKQEIDAVIGHELAHIKNGDMVTLTLIQGVLNAFTMFLARILAFFITQAMRSNSERSNEPSMLTPLLAFVFDIIFGFLSMMIIAWFSRQREFRADRGSAKILGSTQPMIAALKALGGQRYEAENTSKDAMAAFKIHGRAGKRSSLFATHPPLEERIAALQAARL